MTAPERMTLPAEAWQCPGCGAPGEGGQLACAACGAPRYTCPNCAEALHPCALGDDCSLYGWRHPDGAHECLPRLGGRLFTFPAELDPDLDAPGRMRQNVRGRS